MRVGAAHAAGEAGRGLGEPVSAPSHIAIAMVGAGGRMGRAIIAEVLRAGDVTLSAAIDAPGSAVLGHDAGVLAGAGACGVQVVSSLDALAGATVVIDFSSPQSTMDLLPVVRDLKLPTVIGTTGFTDDQKEKIREAARETAIVWAANMSVGVNLLLAVVKQIAATLGDDYDIEIVEGHHRNKKDSPSGTALALAEAAAMGRGVMLGEKAVYGREGIVGARPRGEIGIHAVRGGDIVGDHTVLFATEGERVEVTHKASSRQTFAKGSVVAARFLSRAEIAGDPRLYTMAEVLGL